MTTYTGVLRSGFAAIGGESTGWMLTGSELERPVEVDVSGVREIAEKWDGQKVRVGGRMITRKYVERGDVPVFVVERIDPVM